MQELSYYDRKRIHNLKYYTWVEQQGKSYEEIRHNGMTQITGLNCKRKYLRSMRSSEFNRKAAVA